MGEKARQGDGEYMSRYFFFDNWSIPAEYEKAVPQVFPTIQWDLNYRNPRVFNEMIYNFLFLANKGMGMIRIDAVPYIWKKLDTDCCNPPQVHTIVRMMRMSSYRRSIWRNITSWKRSRRKSELHPIC